MKVVAGERQGMIRRAPASNIAGRRRRLQVIAGDCKSSPEIAEQRASDTEREIVGEEKSSEKGDRRRGERRSEKRDRRRTLPIFERPRVFFFSS